MDEPLTESEQFTLRPELGGLMRIAGISRPGALYGASASERIFETIGEAIVNPIDFEEITDLNMARAASAGNYSSMPGFDEYDRKFKKGQSEAARVNLFGGGKKADISKTHYEVRNLAYFQTRGCEIKISWGNYDTASYCGMVGGRNGDRSTLRFWKHLN